MTKSIGWEHATQNVDGRFWWQWVAANSLAETVGLGGSALVAALLLFGQFEQNILLRAVTVVLISTLIEGSSVGIAQWWLLKEPLGGMRLRDWLVATACGAGIAWTLGMVPSTLMEMQESVAAADSAGPAIAPGLEYLLAAVMGLLLGPVLGTPQWWVLRRYVDRSVWWIGANAIAWAVGMPIIFAAIGLAYEMSWLWQSIFIAIVGLALAGAAVGAIHGAVLVRLLNTQPAAQLSKD